MSHDLTQDLAARRQLLDLADDLVCPPLPLGVTALAALWEREEIVYRCARPDGLSEYPEFSLRLRGAFGRALHALGAGRSLSGRERPHAYEVLFQELPGAPGAAKPFVLRGELINNDVVVTLTLFGAGMAHARTAETALLAALEGGVALSAEARLRVALVPHAAERRRLPEVTFPAHPTVARVLFRSPVAVRDGGEVVSTPFRALASIFRRVERLAAWQGVRLLHDTDLLRQQLRAVELDAQDWRMFRFDRHSLNSGDTAIPAAGALGAIRLTGDLSTIAPYLAMAATCNTGSQAALGMGWFDLAMA